jgi:hypothetical protein
MPSVSGWDRLPIELMNHIIDLSPGENLVNLSLTNKALSIQSRRHLSSRILFSEDEDGSHSFSAWCKNPLTDLAKYVKAIFFDDYTWKDLSSHHKSLQILSSFSGAETLRVRSGYLCFHGPSQPCFTVLKSIRFLLLEDCAVDPELFRHYLQSFGRLELLSISNIIFDSNVTFTPATNPSERQVALHIKSIRGRYTTTLMEVLNCAPFAFSGIHLRKTWLENSPETLAFLERVSQTVTEIGVDSESLLCGPFLFNLNVCIRH